MVHLRLLLLIGVWATGLLRVVPPIPRNLRDGGAAAEERAQREELMKLEAEQKRLQVETIRLLQRAKDYSKKLDSILDEQRRRIEQLQQQIETLRRQQGAPPSAPQRQLQQKRSPQPIEDLPPLGPFAVQRGKLASTVITS